ncbi:hypothetical protein [Nocardia rhizosphaerae]|uniref:Glycosyltransferase n=1 Tax=Nocardia rhizosphaerae TaxID=1691571 RepID=A0ABV8L457_9NOCA
MIAWAVVGHEQRLAAVTDLARTLDAVITLDDGSRGAAANHLKGWAATSSPSSEWAGVAEDDALPVDDFNDQAEAALRVAPADVVSFYLGRTRPRRWQERIPPAIRAANNAKACWLTTTHLLHGVAVVIRAELRDDWLDFAHGSHLPIDERLSAWCLMRGHVVAYTFPSLVDHADGPTLIDHTGQPAGPRIAWCTGTRDHWIEKAVKL